MEILNEWEERGFIRGYSRTLAENLRRHLGNVSDEFRDRLGTLTISQLDAFASSMFGFGSLADAEAFVEKLCRPAVKPDPAGLTIAAFQQYISAKYEAADRAKGTAATWLWFCEEFGELARALARKDDKRNIEEEFADCFAWLCTLANINDVDLTAAIARKYLSAEAKDGAK
jgi:NTP pyrophosphatase (non-canonical NTP hydrolase)